MGTHLKAREERHALVLAARMLAEQGWRDVRVCNVSSRGMMLRCDAPPPRNTFIEIRHQNVCVVGRVVWSAGTTFGINSQDTIDIRALISGARGRPRSESSERRARPRPPASTQMRVLPAEDASRIFARLFDWSALAIAVAAAAMALGDVASAALQRPLDRVRTTLEASQ